MARIDIIILMIVAWAAYRGWKNGLLKEVVSTIGFIVGLVVAYHLYGTFGDFLSPHITQNATIGKVVGRLVAFVLLWIVTPIVLGLLATIATKALKGLKMGWLNSFTGMFLGVLKYMLLLSFVFAAMNKLGILSEEKRQDSKFYSSVEYLSSGVMEHADWFQKSLVRGKQDAQNATPSDAQDADQYDEQDTVWIPIHHKK